LEIIDWRYKARGKACPRNKEQAFLLSLSFFKHIFGSAAHRADPVVREFTKRCVWRDITVGIALFWIIDVTTDFAFPLFHLYLLSEFKLGNAEGREHRA